MQNMAATVDVKECHHEWRTSSHYRTPAVVLIVNISRPGDMSCDTGWPRPPGHGTLYQTSSHQRQPSHHSTLPVLQNFFYIDNTRDSLFWLRSVSL